MFVLYINTSMCLRVRVCVCAIDIHTQCETHSQVNLCNRTCMYDTIMGFVQSYMYVRYHHGINSSLCVIQVALIQAPTLSRWLWRPTPSNTLARHTCKFSGYARFAVPETTNRDSQLVCVQLVRYTHSPQKESKREARIKKNPFCHGPAVTGDERA
jgi:hypothetical protein